MSIPEAASSPANCIARCVRTSADRLATMKSNASGIWSTLEANWRDNFTPLRAPFCSAIASACGSVSTAQTSRTPSFASAIARHPRAGAQIQRSSNLMRCNRPFEQGEASTCAGVLAGAEGHAGIDHDLHPAGRRRAVPRRADIKSITNALRPEVGFPALRPVFVCDLARLNGRCAQRSTDISAEAAYGFQWRRLGKVRDQAHVAIALLPLGPGRATLDQKISHRFAEIP